ncbi:uncharacterized protein SPAPADRAFT_59579 [Spathaspora passalidarum NRRL Y-27907]|uniref:Uncharacterized protein n=1 Tax=Spathaspora passalidarum (strain NRRL Y-27907 / 11-Y1) TaxID=619300 RepID=G3AHJ5_SPAPN|nr:uncharacterized protein SPAPADRAFT_59579 [Spathaspora passalidarum NRRL Y-27907]EGW34160.1 hypothetical protein SPAPADRAFT_59579 [Spathaspora passalidarum NRRL Y-27907]
MDDTDKPDPILKQIPLIKNPSYQPPKPITLNTNYNKLIPSLSNTVIPPKLNVGETEINAWLKEICAIESRLNDNITNDKNVHQFQEWSHQQTIKVAPGFEYATVMQPHKVGTPTPAKEEQQETPIDDNVNELDKVFGKSLNI